MPDCSKNFWNLSPYDAWHCFKQANEWEIIGDNARRIWADFTTTTIGEWVGIVFAFAMIPAMFASYLLPLVFANRALTAHQTSGHHRLDGREQIRKHFWGWYLIAVGLLMAGIWREDRFMFFQGWWQVICGGAILFLKSSWWGRPVRSYP